MNSQNFKIAKKEKENETYRMTELTKRKSFTI